MSKQTAALSKPPSCKWNCIMFCAPWYSLKLQLLMRHVLCFASVTMCRSTYNLVHRGEEIISTADTSCIVVCCCCWSVCTSLVSCRTCLPGFNTDPWSPNACSLIRASRQVNKAVEPYKMSTPWGQPEPVSRHPHADACPPAEATSRGAACGPGHWSSDPACHKYGSSNATEPDVDQVRQQHLLGVMTIHISIMTALK